MLKSVPTCDRPKSTTFAFPSTADLLDVVDGRKPGALHTRYGLNPGIFALEETLAGLEGAEAAWAFCSGMAAETALFLTHGRDGIVCIGDAYGGTLELLGAQLELSPFGGRHQRHSGSKLFTEGARAACGRGCRQIHLEVPPLDGPSSTDRSGRVARIGRAAGFRV